MSAYRQPFIISFSFGRNADADLRDGTLTRTMSPIPGTTQGPAAQPPPASASSQDAMLAKASIFLQEVEGVPQHPYCPGDTSGITLGVGWDASQQTREKLDEDWSALPLTDRDKLAVSLGKDKIGAVARALLPGVKSIVIPKSISVAVLKSSLIPRYYEKTKTAFPGVTFLPDPVQIALLSLVYNRGGGMTNKKGQTSAGLDAQAKTTGHLDRRYEMRRIRDNVANKDIQGIADQLRKMERLWIGTKDGKGLVNRREKEAKLVESALFSKTSATGNI